MSERLTDEQLHILAKVGSSDTQAMAEELLELRSSPAQGVTLSEEERAVLARLVTEIRDECELLADFGNRGEALTILDRLTRTEK